MASFDKNRCLNNIYFLVKEKNLKIGDLEAGAGVSIGYISRLNKDDSKATPSIEFLVSVADKLDVTIDALIQYDYTTPTASERYVMDFLDRLIQKTASFDYPGNVNL